MSEIIRPPNNTDPLFEVIWLIMRIGVLFAIVGGFIYIIGLL